MSKPDANSIPGDQPVTWVARWLLTAALMLPLAACDAPTAGLPDGGSGTDGGELVGDPCAPQVLPAPTGDALLCPVTVVYTPPRAGQVAIAGEWNGFSTTAQPLSGPDAQGAYQVTLQLAPGIYAYKLVTDGSDWQLDPKNAYRKYSGGVENSGLRVPDCHRPSLHVAPGTQQVSRAGVGQGAFAIRVVTDSAAGESPGLCKLTATVRYSAASETPTTPRAPRAG
jgi:hypothetical protein